MVRIDSVIGNIRLSDPGPDRVRNTTQDAPEKSPGAVVSISEEGKKRHILGQVISNISGPGDSKWGVDKT